MAVFDVNEICAYVSRDFRSLDVVLHERLNFLIPENLCVAGNAELPVKDRVPVRHTGFEFPLVPWFAESPRMGQLEANHHVVGGSEPLPVCVKQNAPQTRKIRFRVRRNDQLVGVCAGIRTNRHRLATPDQFGAAFTESTPSPDNELRCSTISCCVPPFHRVYGPAVPDDPSVHVEGLTKRRRSRRCNRILAAQVQPARFDVRAEVLHCFDSLDGAYLVHSRSSRYGV